MSVLKRWHDLTKPAAFSSADYLSRAINGDNKKVSKELKKSILFQTHRDLRENFKRRRNFATYPNERWEADLADFGGRIPKELTGDKRVGRRKQLQMLVVVAQSSVFLPPHKLVALTLHVLIHCVTVLISSTLWHGLLRPLFTMWLS